MMRNKNAIAILGFLAVFFLAGLTYGQEIPAPGTTIDKNNYKKYAHLFPAEFLPIFQDGFGIIQPLSIKVNATRPTYVSDAFLKLSEKNKGKYKLDAEGDVVGLERNGWPFPDVQKSDKDFVTKLMWNYDNNYIFDEYAGTGYSLEKRKGEKIRVAESTAQCLYYTGRLFVQPKPVLPNPLGLYFSIYMGFTAPESMKDAGNLNYRFVDAKKKDASFVYLPAMRRILRADTGQRSTPLGGSLIAPDDTYGFGGRIPEFKYRLVGEQKVLTVTESSLTGAKARESVKKGEFPISTDSWEVKDVYVVEVTPKDPKYPQSKKVLYLDKASLVVYYSTALDKAGKPWKIFMQEYKTGYPIVGNKNDKHNYLTGQFSIDTQFGLANYLWLDPKHNQSNFKYEQFTPSAVLSKAR